MKQIVLFALLTAAALLTTACGPSQVSAHTRELTPIRAYKVDFAEFQNEQRFAAVSEPEAQLDLAFRAGGLVTSIFHINGRALEPGDHVPAGAILARLRPTEYKARLDQAGAQFADAQSGKAATEANVREAEAAFAQAQADFIRAQSLYDVKALTRADLDAARAHYDVQQARLTSVKTSVVSYSAKVESASAAIHERAVPLEDTVLRAPFPAVIVARKIENQSTVAAGTIAYTLADLRRIKISLGIPDTDLAVFSPGSKLRVTVNALSPKPFEGKVIAISAEADPSTRLFQTTALLSNPNGMLRAGLVATVTREIPGQARSLAVPLRALRRLNNQPNGFGVLVIHAGSVELQPVKLGPTMGPLIAIVDGLRPGDFIAEDGGMRLSDGDPVKVVE